MTPTGDTFDFQQGNVVTSSAQIVDSAATVGDVLTVQADKSISAAPGGGSLPDEWTVADDGGLTIAITDDEGLSKLVLADHPTTVVEQSVVDDGGGVTDAKLRLAGQGGGGGTYFQAANGSAEGTSVTANGEGTLSLFTKADRKGIDAWDDMGNVLEFALLPAGQIMTGVVAAPADGDLSASQLAFWFDATDGAAKLKIKAKSADGTVVTGTVNLA